MPYPNSAERPILTLPKSHLHQDLIAHGEQLLPVPGTPTVVRAQPLLATVMLNEAPRPPTEIELRPPLRLLPLSPETED